MTELWIKDQLADINEFDPIPLNFSITETDSVFIKSVPYSKMFKLPDTPTNRLIFERLFNFNIRQNTWGVQKVECVYYVDTIEIFRGFIQLVRTIISRGIIEYEVFLISNKKAILLDIPNDSKLEDLEWPTSTKHSFSASNIFNNISGNTQEIQPYQYYFWDSGNFVDKVIPNEYDYSLGYNITRFAAIDFENYFRPGVYVKSIWDRIFETYGYSYSSTFLESDFFKNLIMPFTNDDLNYSQANGDPYLDVEKVGATLYANKDNILDFDNEILDTFSGFNLATNEYYIAAGAPIQIEINFKYLTEFIQAQGYITFDFILKIKESVPNVL
jgi:hypothetical protein